MSRQFQFSLRSLLGAVCAVGPALLIGRWLLSLTWFGAFFLAFACALLVTIGGSQAALLRLVSQVGPDDEE
jgi:hypothetical protein